MRIVLSMLLLAAYTSVAYSQANTVKGPPCDDPSCIERRYNYRFCNEFGKMVEKCSSDPNNDTEFNPPLRPAKKATPLCLRTDWSSLPFREIIIDPSTDTEPGRNVVVYSTFDMDNIVRQAEATWTHMCPAQGPNKEYDYCCLLVKFSDPFTEFGKLPKDQTRAFVHDPVRDFVGEANYCRTDCYGSELVLNADPAFLQRHPVTGELENFFFTRNLGDLRTLRPDLRFSSALSILLHELGHWLGLGHQSGFDDFGHYCGSEGSIMQQGSVGDWEQVERGITPDDKCQFMKLYCCDASKDKLEVETGREEFARRVTFELIPNPLHTDLLTVKLNEAMLGRASQLRVTNSVGEEILDRPLTGEEAELAVDASGWANGVYFVQIVHDEGVAGQKVTIQR